MNDNYFDNISSNNQLVFVEYSTGKLSRLNLFSPATIVSQGTKVLKGTYTFDLENGLEGASGAGNDIWWDQQTTVARQMVPQNAAGIINLGVQDFDAISADSLQSLPYGTTPIPGSNDLTNKLAAGDVFAVRTSQGNFAKVKVVSYGYDLNIQWVTYQVASGYAMLGTGYTNPEHVKVSIDDVHAYVVERSGNLLRVTLGNANRPAATVVASGMTAPQQLCLDEAHSYAYVIEYASPGHLWRIDLVSGNKTAVMSDIEFGVGLTLSAELHYAFRNRRLGACRPCRHAPGGCCAHRQRPGPGAVLHDPVQRPFSRRRAGRAGLASR